MNFMTKAGLHFCFLIGTLALICTGRCVPRRFAEAADLDVLAVCGHCNEICFYVFRSIGSAHRVCFVLTLSSQGHCCKCEVCWQACSPMTYVVHPRGTLASVVKPNAMLPAREFWELVRGTVPITRCAEIKRLAVCNQQDADGGPNAHGGTLVCIAWHSSEICRIGKLARIWLQRC